LDIEEITNKIDNLEIDESFLDNELLLAAVGVTTGPAGLLVINALKKTIEMKSLLTNVFGAIDDICDDENNTANKSMFDDKFLEKMSPEQLEVVNKIKKPNKSEEELYMDGWS
jgi:hypothetical protein